MTDITLTLVPQQHTQEHRAYDFECNVVYEGMKFSQHAQDLQAVAKEVLYFVAHHHLLQPKYYIEISERGPKAQKDRRELADLLQNPLFKQQADMKVKRERQA